MTKPKLPAQYEWLYYEATKIPMLKNALDLYGTKETVGPRSNPEILAWARELGGWQRSIFTNDDVPWCGLFMAVVAQRSGYRPPPNWQRAMAWSSFGVMQKRPKLGDTVTFTRPGGGHAGIYVGEDKKNFHILGGNQSNEVNIIGIPMTRFYSASRPRFLGSPPRNIRTILLQPNGRISHNEA